MVGVGAATICLADRGCNTARAVRSPSSKLSPTAWLALGTGLALGAAALFLVLAEEVAEDETRKLDVAVLRALAAHRTALWTELFRAATFLGSWPFVSGATLCACVAALIARRRYAALTLALSMLGILPGVVLLKLLYARPRPDVVAHLDVVDSASFPSGHAMAASIFFGTLAILAARDLPRDAHRALIAWCALGLIGLVALSRVYLGVHYPSDVLGGVLVGTTWSLLVVLSTQLAWRFVSPARVTQRADPPASVE